MIKKFLKNKFNVLLLFLFLVFILRVTGVLSFEIVVGSSMENNFVENDFLVSLNTQKFNYGDVVCVDLGDKKVIKRIIALPGDTVEFKNGILYRNGEMVEESYIWTNNTYNMPEVTLKEDEMFICGDNRNSSYDSRAYGAVKMDKIFGKVYVKFPTHLIFKKG